MLPAWATVAIAAVNQAATIALAFIAAKYAVRHSANGRLNHHDHGGSHELAPPPHDAGAGRPQGRPS